MTVTVRIIETELILNSHAQGPKVDFGVRIDAAARTGSVVQTEVSTREEFLYQSLLPARAGFANSIEAAFESTVAISSMTREQIDVMSLVYSTARKLAKPSPNWKFCS